MKVRNGFVSNSSSSSFIVSWPKKPESVEEIHEILFGKSEYIIDYYDDKISTKMISEQVFQDTPDEIDFQEIKDNNSYYCTVHGNTLTWYNKGYGSENFQDLIDEVEILIRQPHETWRINQDINKLKNKELIEKSILRKQKMERLDVEKKSYTDEELRLIQLKKDLSVADENYNKLEKLYNELSNKSAQKFLDDNPGKFICIYDYGNETGHNTVFEYGGIFDNVPHTLESHH